MAAIAVTVLTHTGVSWAIYIIENGTAQQREEDWFCPHDESTIWASSGHFYVPAVFKRDFLGLLFFFLIASAKEGHFIHL